MAIMKMTMTELLSRLKLARNRVDNIYKTMLDPTSLDIDKNRKMLINIATANSDKNLRGISIDQVSDSIVNTYNKINKTISDYRRLNMVKDSVNSSTKIYLPDINDPSKSVEMTITEALVYTSPKVKKYYEDLLTLMKNDYVSVCNVIDEHNKTALSDDKIRSYVIAKMNSLSMNTSENSINYHYSDFASEYVSANEYELIDPLKIDSEINRLETWIEEFYTMIDYTLAQKNSSIEVWIDLDKDSDDDFWGYA